MVRIPDDCSGALHSQPLLEVGIRQRCLPQCAWLVFLLTHRLACSDDHMLDRPVSLEAVGILGILWFGRAAIFYCRSRRRWHFSWAVRLASLDRSSVCLSPDRT